MLEAELVQITKNIVHPLTFSEACRLAAKYKGEAERNAYCRSIENPMKECRTPCYDCLRILIRCYEKMEAHEEEVLSR